MCQSIVGRKDKNLSKKYGEDFLFFILNVTTPSNNCIQRRKICGMSFSTNLIILPNDHITKYKCQIKRKPNLCRKFDANIRFMHFFLWTKRMNIGIIWVDIFHLDVVIMTLYLLDSDLQKQGIRMRHSNASSRTLVSMSWEHEIIFQTLFIAGFELETFTS